MLKLCLQLGELTHTLLFNIIFFLFSLFRLFFLLFDILFLLSISYKESIYSLSFFLLFFCYLIFFFFFLFLIKSLSTLSLSLSVVVLLQVWFVWVLVSASVRVRNRSKSPSQSAVSQSDEGSRVTTNNNINIDNYIDIEHRIWSYFLSTFENSWNFVNIKMREIVHIQAGQCGNQIGAKVKQPLFNNFQY